MTAGSDLLSDNIELEYRIKLSSELVFYQQIRFYDYFIHPDSYLRKYDSNLCPKHSCVNMNHALMMYSVDDCQQAGAVTFEAEFP